MQHSSCHCLRVVGNSEGDMLHFSCHCVRVVGNSEGVICGTPVVIV